MSDNLAITYRQTLQRHHWKCLQDYADITNGVAGRKDNVIFQTIDVAYSTTKKDPIYKLIAIDPSLGPNDGYPCNFFVHDPAMPDIEQGSIVVLKNAFIAEYKNKLQITKNRYTEFALFNQKGLYYSSQGYQNDSGDEDIYLAFKNWSEQMKGSSASHSMVSNKRPFLTTAQIAEDNAKYFNYVGMIVGFFGERGNKREIKLTDFTQNPSPLVRTEGLVDDGTIGNITNEMTLLCTLYQEHAKCGPFRFGDLVFLDNCTRNTNNLLQLEIRVSYSPDDRQHVTKLDPNDVRWQPLLRPLLQRKEAHDAFFNQSASQISGTVKHPMRSRIPGQHTLVPIKQLLEKEEPGVEYIRVTIEKQKPAELTTWLKNYCWQCRITSVPTISDGLDACGRCGNLMDPVYRAMFKVRDESGSELVVLAMDEEAVSV
ncbi:hypothetical protein FB192DRAFT_1361698 [Mucor lusitanicus]|uniref:Telomeric single stranded DNA binding POT1/Cdc13 domain-containing protein n=1 Tax=Mucor circinelloides f. lusitanicus TaxID=29924 RepID=A0A8H4F515_MUCCL|nr:hypothetical protein FB192DRAFT_1361698 [Mucor lusitanicus]